MCGIMVEYVQKDDVKIMSKVIGVSGPCLNIFGGGRGCNYHIKGL